MRWILTNTRFWCVCIHFLPWVRVVVDGPFQSVASFWSWYGWSYQWIYENDGNQIHSAGTSSSVYCILSPLKRVELRNWMIMSYSFIMKISIHISHQYLVMFCPHDLERSFQHGHASNRSLCRYPFKDWWLFHSNGGIELSECRCQNGSSHSSCVYIQWGIRNHANLNSKHLLYWRCPLQQRRINTCMKLLESSHGN